MQEFLRNIPGSLFGSQRYIEFVASNDVEDVGRRAHMISRYVSEVKYIARLISVPLVLSQFISLGLGSSSIECSVLNDLLGSG